ncbi:MAG: ATP-grasp domain-containing protein [Acidobacteriota bacterium]
MTERRTILCMTSYEKGQEFLRQCCREDWRVLLLTVEKLAQAAWPRDIIDEVFLMPDLGNRAQVINAVSYLARSKSIDRIVALDEFDIEMAATLREHLRIPGMGETTSRYFRDKLAMRIQAREYGIAVPDFVAAINHNQIRRYIDRVPGPWVLKPRSSASAIGIQKLSSADELWRALEQLGDEQSHRVLEHFVPGDIFHVDSIISEREVVFATVSRYGQTPLAVMHEGGIFSTRMLPRESADVQALESLNRELARALGFVRGVTHAEFIKGRDDGRFYFLETAARVGGANIAETIEAGTGVNLWAEWARIETSTPDRPYTPPKMRHDYSGIVISLARQEWPDTTGYSDSEIVWRLERRHHAGLIVRSPDPERVRMLLESYVERFSTDFFAFVPPPARPTD